MNGVAPILVRTHGPVVTEVFATTPPVIVPMVAMSVHVLRAVPVLSTVPGTVMAVV